MNDRLPEIFGAGFAARMPLRDITSRAIAGDDARMVDRNIGGALVEVP